VEIQSARAGGGIIQRLAQRVEIGKAPRQQVRRRRICVGLGSADPAHRLAFTLLQHVELCPSHQLGRARQARRSAMRQFIIGLDYGTNMAR
jgi:hypothetical protein